MKLYQRAMAVPGNARELPSAYDERLRRFGLQSKHDGDGIVVRGNERGADWPPLLNIFQILY